MASAILSTKLYVPPPLPEIRAHLMAETAEEAGQPGHTLAAGDVERAASLVDTVRELYAACASD